MMEDLLIIASLVDDRNFFILNLTTKKDKILWIRKVNKYLLLLLCSIKVFAFVVCQRLSLDSYRSFDMLKVDCISTALKT